MALIVLVACRVIRATKDLYLGQELAEVDLCLHALWAFRRASRC